MKNTVIISLAAAFFLVLSPFVLLKGESLPVSAPAYDIGGDIKNTAAGKSFKIKTDAGIEKINAADYLVGVLAGEVSPLYEKEALKAQTVAAYTFALRRAAYAKQVNREYDLTDNPSTDQCYVSKAAAKEKWGEKAEEYLKTLEDAVNEVLGEYLTYENQVALTVYHAVSPGMTNSSEDVWGNALPYLVSCDSVGDKLSPNYLSEAAFSIEEFKEKLKDLCDIGGSAADIGEIKKSKSGLVLSIELGGKALTGAEVAGALSLKSAAFDLDFADNTYRFTVYGRGHGVGMSQTGAEYMAKQGSNYEEILLHYYKGCKLKKS